jgi:hypothetical protein
MNDKIKGLKRLAEINNVTFIDRRRRIKLTGFGRWVIGSFVFIVGLLALALASSVGLLALALASSWDA